MALPTKEKTWQYDPNILISTGDEYNNIKTALLNIKNTLTTFGSNPWTVSGSSNKTAAGMDGVDRWSTIADIVPGTAGSTTHSWIVLKQSQIHANFEICIDLGYTNMRYSAFVIGVSGFTGGSTTNRPTATTQIVLNNNNAYWYPHSNTNNIVLQIMQSIDGECTRIVWLMERLPVMFWMFDKPKNPVSGWTNPFIVIYNNSITVITQLSLNTYSDVASIDLYANSTTATAYIATEGYGSATTLENLNSINQITNEYEIYPLSIVSETTNTKGRLGQIYDLWWGPASAANLGSYVDTTYPNDSTRQFWQCDDFVFPWSGTSEVAGPKIKVGL